MKNNDQTEIAPSSKFKVKKQKKYITISIIVVSILILFFVLFGIEKKQQISNSFVNSLGLENKNNQKSQNNQNILIKQKNEQQKIEEKTVILEEQINKTNKLLIKFSNNLSQEIKKINQEAQKNKINTQNLKQQIKSLLLSFEQKNKDLQQKLLALNKNIKAIKKQQIKIYPPPFELLSVDIWNGQAQAQITVGQNKDIVNVSDYRLGWYFSNIDFDKQSITVLKNKSKVNIVRNTDKHYYLREKIENPSPSVKLTFKEIK